MFDPLIQLLKMTQELYVFRLPINIQKVDNKRKYIMHPLENLEIKTCYGWYKFCYNRHLTHMFVLSS